MLKYVKDEEVKDEESRRILQGVFNDANLHECICILVCNKCRIPLYGINGVYHNTGWRRLIGSPKLQIIFHKRATNYRALLRKMTYKDKGSYESSPPCM